MLNWAWVFIIAALAAAIVGFTSLALVAAAIAKVIFFLLLVLFLLTLVSGLGRRA